MENAKYAVIGGGLVGSLLSVILAKRGFHVDVWERRPDLRTTEIEGGRSINLALSNRGFKALELIGLANEVRKLCIPMYGRCIHDEKGEVRFMQYGKEGEAINSVSRGGLNQLMLRKAGEHADVVLNFNEACRNIDFPTGDAIFENVITGNKSKKKYDVIFGTDGAFSAARLSLMKTDRFDFQYRQDYLDYGYKELSIPAADGGGWRIDKNALHIWPRGHFMMIALPNLDGSFTCTLFLNLEGEVAFNKLNSAADVRQFFDRYFPDALAQMPTLEEDFFHNPTSSLVTVKCYPWQFDGKGLLLGDAAHAIVPFYGQGMNAGFEDCSVLNELIDRYQTDWNKIFFQFTRLRKPNSDAIADLALANFIEMRDLVADPHFILKSSIDKKIASLFPDKWSTLYSMVTFSDVPYAEAQRIGREHNEILERLIKDQPGIGYKINTDEFREIVENYID